MMKIVACSSNWLKLAPLLPSPDNDDEENNDYGGDNNDHDHITRTPGLFSEY